jgi:curved DNA-binding protein CbpA
MARPRVDRDYYAILGVPPGASADDIRRAYRRLALRWHPDRNPGEPTATERFTEISEAYAVLIDPARRREWDRARQVGSSESFHARREDLFRDLFADPRASAVFDELTAEFARLGLRVDRHVFQQTLFGGRGVVTGGVIVISPLTPLLAITRLAAAALRGPRPTASREGMVAPRAGLVAQLARAGRWLLGLPAARALAVGDLVVPLMLTREEARRGGPKRVTLARDGMHEDLIVTIPAGTRAGTRLRLRGKGVASPGRPPGDAYLAVEIAD